jgi:protein phosphatase
MLMVWIGVGIAVAFVLLIVVRAMMGGDTDAASVKPAEPVAKPVSKAPAAKLFTPTTGKVGKRDDDQEPEGTKVASVPPPAVTKGMVKDVALEEQKMRASEGRSGPDITIDTESMEEDDLTGPIALILVTAVGRTDAGKRRKHNEDSYLVLPDHNLFVIADGMGGYAAGEVASALATEVISEAYKTSTFVGESDPTRPKRGDELVRAIQMSNEAILTQARANEAQHGMGTTLVSCRFSPNKQRVYIAHVGDSRCYRVRGTEIKQMTADHTLGAVGITGPAAAKLSRAVGIADTVEVDLTIDHPQVGDYYMLCSDGLSKMVPDDMICKIMVEESDLDKSVNKLVDTANERGGRDNITVILIRVEQPVL